MNKIYLHIVLSVAIILQLFALTSCHESEELQPAFTAADSLQVLHDTEVLQSVLTFLTGQPDVDINAATPLTATFGTVRDEAKPFTRAYPADDADEAEGLFRCIAGSVDDCFKSTTDGLQLSLEGLHLALGAEPKDMGTLTFHRGGDGSVAYADVNIPRINNLNRIEYLDSASWGENAVTGGYKKGDILRYIGNDSRITKNSLWICSRQVNGGIEGCLSLLEYRPGSSLSLEGKKDDPNYAPCPVTQFSGDVTKKYSSADSHRVVALRELLNLLATMDKKKKEKILKQFPDALPVSDYTSDYEAVPYFRAPAGNIYNGYNDQKCAIIYDAYYISNFWVYDSRRICYVTLPQTTTKVSQVKDNTFTYIEKSTWTKQFWNLHWHSLFIYNAKYFTDRLDTEFVVVLSP